MLFSETVRAYKEETTILTLLEAPAPGAGA